MQSDWRSQARALAMQCLTQLDVQGGEFLFEMDSFIAEASVPSESKTLAAEMARTAWTHHETCDVFIAETVKHWQLQRIALIDRAILRLAISELVYRPDVPMKVVLDQGIELAKKFSTAESPQFINGVLDAIAKKVHEPGAPSDAPVSLEPADSTEIVQPANRESEPKKE